MNSIEVKRLRAGDRVVWPEGANACKQAYGTVTETREYGKHIVWDDETDLTHCSDEYSMQFVKKF